MFQMRQINMRYLDKVSPDSLLQEHEAFRPFFTLPLVARSPSFLYVYIKNILLNLHTSTTKNGAACSCETLLSAHNSTLYHNSESDGLNCVLRLDYEYTPKRNTQS
jgi:hypothetical protein